MVISHGIVLLPELQGKEKTDFHKNRNYSDDDKTNVVYSKAQILRTKYKDSIAFVKND